MDDLFDPLEKKISDSVALLKEHEPDDGYFGGFSGGKDSVVVEQLARIAGVSVRWQYQMTTIDPPEVVRFIRDRHPDVEFIHPLRGNFFKRVEEKGFPTRRNRWCCREYKESRTPSGATVIVGVRAAESPRRAARWEEIQWFGGKRSGHWALAPILRWSDEDVWEFIRSRNLSYCKLYDEGFKRLGCIGCPMAQTAGKLREFARWPRYEMGWKRAFRRLWERKPEDWTGKRRFKTWEEMWEWWLLDGPWPKEFGAEDGCQTQISLFSNAD